MGTPEPPPVVIIAPAPPERAPEAAAAEERPSHYATLGEGGVEISLGTLFFQPSLGRTYFDGSGKALNTDVTQSFHHRGRELGFDTPLMWGGELSIHYMRRYLAVGLLGFIAGHPGAADSDVAPSGAMVPDVNRGALTAWGGGVDVAGAVPFGIVAFRPGVVLGLRSFSMPITGFEKTTCRTKTGPQPCYERADTPALGFVEPRLRIVITPPRSGVSFGAYVGMEAVGGTGPTAGLFFGFGTAPHEGMRP